MLSELQRTATTHDIPMSDLFDAACDRASCCTTVVHSFVPSVSAVRR